VGGVFMVEHLGVVKLLIEKVAKYLLLPGLDLDINLNIRVRNIAAAAAAQCSIFVCLQLEC
jgi:hypothetical protein